MSTRRIALLLLTSAATPHLIAQNVDPKVLFRVEPAYCKSAKASRIEGTVSLKCIVGADGKARDIQVSKCLEGSLDANAIAALKKWTFQPGSVNGTAAARPATIKFTFQLPGAFAPTGIDVRTDTPLQTAWAAPKKPPSARTHEGLLKADTYSWKCYPSIGQALSRDKKWLVLNVYIDGPSRFSYAPILFSVDGTLTELPAMSWRTMQLLGGVPAAETAIPDQERLIERIAEASEVFVTILENNRHSLKLTAPQLQTFRDVLAYYHSLTPKD
jgi:TonB family protein